MRYRALDADGDMKFGNQQADFLRNSPDAVAQAVVTRLRLWLGEWFIDQTEGTPYQQAVLGKHTMNSVEPAIRSRILNTEGVEEIVSFELLFDADERTMRISASIDTIYGQVQLTEIL